MIHFDGVNDYYLPSTFIVPKLGVDIDFFSMSFWFKAPTFTTPPSFDRLIQQGVIGGAGMIELYIEVGTQRRLIFSHRSTSGTTKFVISTTKVDDNVLRHVLLTYGALAANGKMYLDGVDDNAFSSNTTDPASTLSVALGARNDGTIDYLGEIGELAVWDDLLLSSADAVRLAAGVSPWILVGQKPRLYKPMVGHIDAAGVPNYKGANVMEPTKVGTPGAAGWHPPVLFAGA